MVPVVQALEWFLAAAASIHRNLMVSACNKLQVYKGIQLPDSESEISRFRVQAIQSDAKTLTDKEGQKFLGRLEREIEKQAGELRRE